MKKLMLFATLFVFCLGMDAYTDLGDITLRPGMTHPDITELQQKLDMLGYFDYHKYTGYYGDITEAAVRKFQEDYGLKVDGIASSQTISYIEAKIRQIQYIKEKEEEERELAAYIQQSLKNLGLYSGEITSVIDEATREAIKAFQEREGLEITGEVDSNTVARLNELFPKPTKEEKSTNLISSRAFVDFTRSFLGKPYVYGACSGQAFDCSGLTTYIMKNYGINLDRTASQQFKKGTPVAKEDLKPGDLVFFSSNGKTIGHVGIYIGDNKFIHASSSKKKVIISDLSAYKAKYQGARRYIELNYEE